MDEAESVFPHRLLSLQLQVDSGLGEGPHTGLRQILSDGWSLLKRLGQRIARRVFAWQVAHLTHYSGLGVHIGAVLTSPLGERKTKRRRKSRKDISSRGI